MFPLQIPVRINHPMSHSKNIWPGSPHRCPFPSPPAFCSVSAWLPGPCGCARGREGQEGPSAEKPPGVLPLLPTSPTRLVDGGVGSIKKGLSANPGPWEPRADFKSSMRDCAQGQTNRCLPGCLWPCSGASTFLEACFPGWGWVGAGVRAPFQSVRFPPPGGAQGQSHQWSTGGGGPLLLSSLHRRQFWRNLCPCLMMCAWTLEVGRLRPPWGARLSHQGEGEGEGEGERGGGCTCSLLPPPGWRGVLPLNPRALFSQKCG